MDLRQLAALVAVAEAGSFSGAARLLHTVQSNVSTHVARLERELGATLVDRTTGALTDEGDAVVDRARRIQHELEALRSDVDALLHDVTGTARVGCIGTVGRWLVPQLLVAMRDRHPKVSPVIVDATTTSLLPAADRAARPGRGQPAGRRPRARRPRPSSTRTASWSPPTTTRWPSSSGSSLAELADYELLLEPQGTVVPRRTRPRGGGGGRHAATPGRGRRPAPRGLADLRGLRRRGAAGDRRADVAARAPGGGSRSTAWPPGRSAWPTAAGLDCPLPHAP